MTMRTPSTRLMRVERVFMASTLDPNTLQDSYYKVIARIGLAGAYSGDHEQAINLILRRQH